MTKSTTELKRIIKTGTCPTLTEKSTLQYQIGCDDQKNIFFRIVSNTGNGFFNDDWVALSDIQSAFDSWPVDNPITSFALHGLFLGRSANTSAFLLAALKEEGIVATLKDKRRCHEYVDPPTEFMAEMDKLIASGVSLEADNEIPTFVKEPTAKPSIKRSKTTRKKTIKKS